MPVMELCVCVLQLKSRNLMVAFEEERLHRDREVQEVRHPTMLIITCDHLCTGPGRGHMSRAILLCCSEQNGLINSWNKQLDKITYIKAL